MSKLKIERVDGTTLEGEITPSVEYAFEQHFKKGFFKAFREEEMQTSLYWVAWEVTRASGETVEMFGLPFINTLKSVEVVEGEPLT